MFTDHHGRLVGKRTDGEFYFDVVLADGTENCDYLLACDLDNTPLPGFRWASYEQGYGDMRGVVDETTIRYLPWIDNTAMVLVDLVDVDSGAPVEVSPRRMLQRQVDKAAAAGYVAMFGSEIEFFLFKEGYDDANAAGYRDLTPNSPYVEDYHILQTTKEEDVLGAIRRGLAGAGLPVEFSKGEAGRASTSSTSRTRPAVEMADINVMFKTAVKEIADAARQVGDVHGQAALRRRRLELPHPLQPVAPTASVMPDRTRRRWRRRHHDPHHMSDLFRWYLGGQMATAREFACCSRRRSTATSASSRAPGRRPPSVGTSTTARSGSASSATARGCASRTASRAPTPTPTTPSRPSSPAACTASPTASSRRRRTAATATRPTDLARIPSTFAEAIELWRDSPIARECFGDDVHHHVLHAETEWPAFNSTVTDWERRRYFERI